MALPTVTNPFGTGGPIVTGNPFGTGSFHPFGTTKPVSGGDTSFDAAPTNNVGKTVGIAVGVTLGCYLIGLGIALAVFIVRQRNRKAWYGPTAEYYRNGGHTLDLHNPSLPLLSNAAKSFAPSTVSSPAPSYTQYPALAYQRSPSPSTVYSSEVSFGYGNPQAQYYIPPNDQTPTYGQPYLQPYDSQTGTGAPHAGSTTPVIQV